NCLRLEFESRPAAIRLLRTRMRRTMNSRIKGAGFLVAALLLAGCNGSIDDIAPKAEKELPQKLVDQMKSKGMSTSSPIMVRLFKEEGQLEVWKQKGSGGY